MQKYQLYRSWAKKQHNVFSNTFTKLGVWWKMAA